MQNPQQPAGPIHNQDPYSHMQQPQLIHFGFQIWYI